MSRHSVIVAFIRTCLHLKLVVAVYSDSMNAHSIRDAHGTYFLCYLHCLFITTSPTTKQESLEVHTSPLWANKVNTMQTGFKTFARPLGWEPTRLIASPLPRLPVLHLHPDFFTSMWVLHAVKAPKPRMKLGLRLEKAAKAVVPRWRQLYQGLDVVAAPPPPPTPDNIINIIVI